MKKKVGIITFHNSYNCGSMLETYAMQQVIDKQGFESEIVNFSSEGQRELYSVFNKNNKVKNIIKNIILFPNRNKVLENNEKYRKFQKQNFNISKSKNLSDTEYFAVIAGSDQIWNITIPDYDDAYFLNWVKRAKKIAYAPSFGAKNIVKNTTSPQKYIDYLNSFDFLSVREFNGQRWIGDLINKDVPVVLDPTLLLEKSDYSKIVANDIVQTKKYIFFYCPGFDSSICKFVKKVSEKYNLDVIVWSSKQYYIKNIKRFGFQLADYENPSSYLFYINNAELIFTTSFHGTIFSTIFKKKFFTIKNGGMFGDDDRVLSLVKQLSIEERLITYEFQEEFDYLCDINYTKYDRNLKELKKMSLDYLTESLKK